MKQQKIHIIVDKRSSRMQYVASELLERRLGLEVVLCTELSVIPSNSFLLNYSSHSIGGVPGIPPSKLLFEKRMHAIDVETENGDLPKLFPLKGHPLGFDPIAASFYLLTRYEEYFPHRKDEHGRYSTDHHLLVSKGWHQKPLVDLYANALGTWLQQFYKGLELPQHAYKKLVSVDVDQLFSVKAKGLVRGALSAVKDVFRGKIVSRIAVLVGRLKDPNDMYDELVDLCRRAGIKPIFFFQVGENSRFDINNPPHLYEVRQRINELGLQADVGLHPSYYSSENSEMMQLEFERIRAMASTPVRMSRQHYLRFKIPATYRELSRLGVEEEHSMGYHDRNGFRAGTCHPFKLFDLERDETIQITLIPMVWMDLTAQRSFGSMEGTMQELLGIIDEVKQVGGIMSTTWHPEVLVASDESYDTWKVLEAFSAHV